MIEFVKALDAEERALRKRYEGEVQAVERAAYAKIAAARFAVWATASIPTRPSPCSGKVAGYQDGEEKIPAFTSFGGVYSKARERAGEEWYTLPESWVTAAPTVDRSTPFNLVTDHDIIGGNSGSPVIDAKGEVVGLIFDGNIHSLIGNFAYSDVKARSVSVDSRGIVGALRDVRREAPREGAHRGVSARRAAQRRPSWPGSGAVRPRPRLLHRALGERLAPPRRSGAARRSSSAA